MYHIVPSTILVLFSSGTWAKYLCRTTMERYFNRFNIPFSGSCDILTDSVTASEIVSFSSIYYNSTPSLARKFERAVIQKEMSDTVLLLTSIMFSILDFSMSNYFFLWQFLSWVLVTNQEKNNSTQGNLKYCHGHITFLRSPYRKLIFWYFYSDNYFQVK